VTYEEDARAVGARADAELAGYRTDLAECAALTDRQAAVILSAQADVRILEGQLSARDATILELRARIAALELDDTRPSGPDWVKFEDLYRTGDTDITMSLERLTLPKFVSFPGDRFLFRDFSRNPGTFTAGGVTYPTGHGFYIPKLVRGIKGMGRGETEFEMVAGSSTKRVQPQSAGGTTALTAMQAGGGHMELMEDFTLTVGEQGHRCHGLSVFDSKAAQFLMRRVHVEGTYGDNGAPPGEQFCVTVHGGRKNVLEDVSADGLGGSVVGITIQDAARTLMVRPKVTGCKGGQIVLYRAAGTRIEDMDLNKTAKLPTGSGPGIINLEQTTGTVLVRPKIYGGTVKSSVHISHSNNEDSLVIDGETFTWADGTLEVQDPDFVDLWPTSNGTVPGVLTIETWGTDGAELNRKYGVTSYVPGTHYYDRKPAGMHTAPVVTRDGKHIPFNWVRYGTHNKRTGPYVLTGP